MPFMEWDDKLSVKHMMIDTDHKKLVEMINQLHDAMMARKGAEVVGKVLSGLVDYTRTHFGREEALMASTSYPDFPAHRDEHDKLIAQVKVLQGQFDKGCTHITLETMDFLRNWLFNHIMKVDQKLGQWIASRPA